MWGGVKPLLLFISVFGYLARAHFWLSTMPFNSGKSEGSKRVKGREIWRAHGDLFSRALEALSLQLLELDNTLMYPG